MKYTLEKICTSLVRGPFGSALKKDFFVEPSEDTYKVYEQGNAIRKSKDYGQYYIDKKKYEELKRFEVRPYDFIMSCSGTIGELYQLPEGAERGIINQALLKITLNNDLVDYDYFSYIFKYNIANLEAKGSGIQNVASIKVLKEIEFEIPDLQTQKSIVAVLKKAENLIKYREQELNLLDKLIKARFVEMFGDYHTNSKGFECHPGSELFKFSSGKFLPEERRLDEGIPVYGGNGIAWYTDEPLIDHPTVIIGRVGAWCGNIHTVLEPVWITDNAIYIKELKTDKFTLEFLTELMKVMDFHQYADFSGQPKITQKPLETLNYLTPPVEMQIEFTDFVKQVDKSKVAVQKSLEETQKLFDSLMQEYFG